MWTSYDRTWVQFRCYWLNHDDESSWSYRIDRRCSHRYRPIRNRSRVVLDNCLKTSFHSRSSVPVSVIRITFAAGDVVDSDVVITTENTWNDRFENELVVAGDSSIKDRFLPIDVLISTERVDKRRIFRDGGFLSQMETSLSWTVDTVPETNTDTTSWNRGDWTDQTCCLIGRESWCIHEVTVFILQCVILRVEGNRVRKISRRRRSILPVWGPTSEPSDWPWRRVHWPDAVGSLVHRHVPFSNVQESGVWRPRVVVGMVVVVVVGIEQCELGRTKTSSMAMSPR